MKIKTSELQGAALDWAVAKCENLEHYFDGGLVCLKGQPFDTYWLYWIPTTDWAQGGPIIDKTGICLSSDHEDAGDGWIAYVPNRGGECWGDTALVAAMRAYVASQLGGEVELPEELIEVKLCS